jgi:hypothetical protein
MQKRKLGHLEVSALGYGPAGDMQEKKCHFAIFLETNDGFMEI